MIAPSRSECSPFAALSLNAALAGQGTRVTPRTSRTAVLVGPKQVQIVERALPEPGPGQVRVRLEGCGVCASNLPVWEGRPWFSYPMAAGAPGHEGWGRVDAVHGSVSTLREGDRVAFLSGGAYAEHEVVDAHDVVVLPELLDDQPFPGEPLGCVMNILARSDIRAGHTVAIVGAGFLGVSLVALAAQRGARVAALSRRAWARAQAAGQGAHATFALDDDGVEAARHFAGRDGFERVVECVGTQQALDAASALCATRSRLVIAGYHQDGPRTVDMQSWNWRGLDVINAHERDPAQYRAGMEAAVSAVVCGQFDPRPLYTHRLPLYDLARAFELLAVRPTGFLKALITFPSGATHAR